MFEIIPLIQSYFGISGLDMSFEPIWSILTWAIYVFGVPTFVIACMYFAGIDKTNPRRILQAKILFALLIICLTIIYSPLKYGVYQETSKIFWLIFTLYNFGLGIVATAFMRIGIRSENNTKLKKQKKQVVFVVTPPFYYWLISVFIVRLINISEYFFIWQFNLFIVLICVIVFIIAAFRDGFMGLKLISQNYDWNTSMNLMNTSTEYTSHMIKQQTSTMELCIDQLKSHYIASDSDNEVLERLDILSRSVDALTKYTNRTRRHSQIINLFEERCGIAEMLDYVISTLQMNNTGAAISSDIGDNVYLFCDRVHMIEVFTNILLNSFEAFGADGAVSDNGAVIEITGGREKSKYRIRFKDNGAGMDDDVIKDIFNPHFSTKKSREKNFGLGLYYCANVVAKHGGSISAESEHGKGTVITIAFPARRVTVNGGGEVGAVEAGRGWNKSKAVKAKAK